MAGGRTWKSRPGCVARLPTPRPTSPESATSTFTIGTDTVTVDLSSTNTYADIAAAIETVIIALGGTYAGASFDYLADPQVFQLELAGTDALPDPFFGDTDAVTDTDIATLLGMAEASGPLHIPGSAAESLAAALAAMRRRIIGRRAGGDHAGR